MLLIAAQSISAQNNFKARISDINSKEPLVGATAVVKGTSLGSTTNIDGILEISNLPDGPLSIEFRYVGYETLTIVYAIPIRIQGGYNQERSNQEKIDHILRPGLSLPVQSFTCVDLGVH